MVKVAEQGAAIHSHMTNTRITDVEVLERRYPVHVRKFAIRKNSGGAGNFSGGNGIIREIMFLAPVEVSLPTQRRKTAPFGMAGGASGKPGKNLLKRNGTDKWKELEPLAQLHLAMGDVIRIETPGGGGFGIK